MTTYLNKWPDGAYGNSPLVGEKIQIVEALWTSPDLLRQHIKYILETGEIKEMDRVRLSVSDPWGFWASRSLPQHFDMTARLTAEITTLRARLETVEADRAAQAERMARLEAALRRLLKCEYDGQGLTDCIDNDGCHYPSQELADAIANAEAAVSARALSQEGSDA